MITLWSTDARTMDERFRDFDAGHPEVWRLYQRFANELLAAGHQHGSSEMIMQRLRWETAVNPEREGGFKINDHFRARYARKLAAADPRFKTFFAFRSLGRDS